MSDGVKIYLAPGVVLPAWILSKLEKPDDDEKIKVEFEEVTKGQKIRVLKIVGGEASFCCPTKHGVIIKFPDEQHAWGAGFDPQAVLQISTLDGARVERNRLLCEHCFETTGQVARYEIKPAGPEETQLATVFKCNNSWCGHEWES